MELTIRRRVIYNERTGCDEIWDDYYDFTDKLYPLRFSFLITTRYMADMRERGWFIGSYLYNSAHKQSLIKAKAMNGASQGTPNR